MISRGSIRSPDYQDNISLLEHEFYFLIFVLCKPHSVLLARVALYLIGATSQV